MSFRPTLRGCGLYVPERVLTNDEISAMVDTSDEWIFSRSGIRRRRVAAPDETTTTLAVRAARAALANAGLDGSAIDLTIVATSTPDYGFPASACMVQHAVGARGGAFDLEAACSGFVYALSIACSMIQIGAAHHVLVIGSEVMTRTLDWTDRRTCFLFGDGAGAVVVSRSAEPGPMPLFRLGSDGSGAQMLVMPAVGIAELPTAERPEVRGMRMNGPETFKFGVRIMVEVSEQIMAAAGLTPAEIDWLIPHQANQRIMNAGSRRLGFADGQVMSNIAEYGNTTAASIPIALAEWQGRGEVLPGQRILAVGFGAGLTWGAGLIGWRD